MIISMASFADIACCRQEQSELPDAADVFEVARLTGLSKIMSSVLVRSSPNVYSLSAVGFRCLCRKASSSCEMWSLAPSSVGLPAAPGVGKSRMAKSCIESDRLLSYGDSTRINVSSTAVSVIAGSCVGLL